MCAICDYANEHGSWPTDHRGTHCEDCHRSWAGKREAHCTVCHAHFSADSLAERHRQRGVCMTRDQMLITVSKSGIPTFRECDTKNGKIWRGGEALSVKPAYLVGQDA